MASTANTEDTGYKKATFTNTIVSKSSSVWKTYNNMSHIIQDLSSITDESLLSGFYNNVSHPVVQLGFVIIALRSSIGWLAGTVATYSPSSSSEHMKKNITKYGARADATRYNASFKILFLPAVGLQVANYFLQNVQLC